MVVPFLLAPMAELSHRPLRELIEGFGGCDEYFTEMISSGALISGGQFEAFYLDTAPCPQRVVFQLLGSDADQLTRAAAFLDGLPCAGIDLNMGCSAPAIIRQGAGVRWMADIDRAGKLVRLVRARTRCRLSVKLRIGMEDNFDYLLGFCRRLADEGVERITLHPRTAREKFKRSARWDYVAHLREGLPIPVAGNGDIADAGELAGRSGVGICDAVMVGRAAVRMPWIFAEARAIEGRAGSGSEKAGAAGSGAAASGDTGFAPGTVDIEETGLRFLELLTRYQPREFHLSRARRFFGYFCGNIKWAHYLKTALNREQTLAGIERVWRAYFAEHPEETRAGPLRPGGNSRTV
jgi:tRNA-dihydrouridine synthase